MRRDLALLALAGSMLGGCILLYNPDSYQIGHGGGGHGGGGITASSGTVGGNGGAMTTTSSSSGMGGVPCGTVEICNNGLDDDCSGGPDCKLAAVWQQRVSDNAHDSAFESVALTPSGVYVAGWFNGGFALGGGAGTLNEAYPGRAALAASFSRGGTPMSADEVGKGASDNRAFAVAASMGSAPGPWVVTGALEKSPGSMTYDAFVEQLGAPTWKTTFSGESHTGTAIAYDTHKDVFVAIYSAGTGDVINCGGDMVDANVPMSQKGVLVLKLEAGTGNCLWGLKITATGIGVAAMTVDAQGNLLLAGQYSGKVSGVSLPDALETPGAGAFVIARDGAQGGPVWSTGFLGTSSSNNPSVEISAIAAEPGGTVYAGGRVLGSFPDLMVDAPQKDAFLFAVDGNGGFKWSKRFGGEVGERHITAIGVKPSTPATVYVAGVSQHRMAVEPDSEAATLCEHDGGIFLLALDTAGKPRLADCFGGGVTNLSLDHVKLAVDDGLLVLAGRRKGTIDFHLNPALIDSGHQDAFIAGFAPP